MKTYKPYLNTFTINRLQIDLIEKIGFRISNKPDCAKLSDLIHESGGGHISEATLYRLFFQSEKHRPYKSTLDILCKFLGYNDSIDFFQIQADSSMRLHHSGISRAPFNSNGLLLSCIENRSKKSLLDFFKETYELDYLFKINVGIAIFDSLLKSHRQNWFFKEFAEERYIREYFFEWGHDPKFRIKNYDQAYKMYLESVHWNKDLVHFQDFIFGNSVLFRYYFVNQKISKATTQAQLLYQVKLDVDANKTGLFIFPFIRYTAYRLWYLELMNAKAGECEGYAFYLIDLCQQLKNQLGKVQQKFLFHTVAETFVHSSLPESFHWELKEIFREAFNYLPEVIYSKHLKYSLNYFNENGLLHFRP
jgi:hypothetical protein